MKKLNFILFLLLFISVPVWAQEPAAIAVDLIVTQKGDMGVDLKATVTDEENGEPVKGLILQFSGSAGAQTITLGEATTDEAGIAEIKNANWANLRKNAHAFTFTATFAGNDSYLKNEVSTDLKEAVLTVKAETIDSVNYITVTATSWNEKGESAPLAEGEVKVYVPRMFSLLPIGDITTDEDGYGELKFPNDLPVGAAGEVVVVARIEEDANLANVEAAVSTPWGVKNGIQPSKLPRALWSPDAPLWMVITFIILMAAVWYHYGLIVYELIRVSRESKAADKLDYSE